MASSSATVGASLPAISPLHVAYSARLFPGLNENDAKAAIRIWAQTMGKDQDIPVDPDTPTLRGKNEIIDAIRYGQIDAVTLPLDEYWAVRKDVQLGPFIIGSRRGKTTEQYVLLVREDGPYHILGDLRHASLMVMADARSVLGPPWLETELLEQGLGDIPSFWKRTVAANNASKSILPVFFRQAEACLTTRDAFETMAELNPQVGRQLRILISSPELLPVVFCFREGIQPEKLRRLCLTVPKLRDVPGTRQILTLFQCEDLELTTGALLEAPCELLDRHQALLSANSRGETP